MTDSLSPAGICDQLLRSCAPLGFDLAHALQVGWYNDAVAQAYRVPDFGNPGALAVIIGNTRALWPVFRAALRADGGQLLSDSDPLDRYTEQVLWTAIKQFSCSYELRFSHQAPPERVAMQRLAHVSGFARLSEGHLNVHPTYGPWIGLRAMAVFDLPGPAGPAPVPASPCVCTHQCEPLFQVALAGGASLEEDSWQRWLAVRDACPVGREHRYDDDQIRYHYLKDRSVL